MSTAAAVLSLLLAAVSLGAGIPKARLKGEVPETLRRRMGLSDQLIRFIGLAEVGAAFGLVVGLLWRPLGIAAADGLIIVFLGAIGFHAKAGDYTDPEARRRATTPAVLALAAIAAVITLTMS